MSLRHLLSNVCKDTRYGNRLAAWASHDAIAASSIIVTTMAPFPSFSMVLANPTAAGLCHTIELMKSISRIPFFSVLGELTFPARSQVLALFFSANMAHRCVSSASRRPSPNRCRISGFRARWYARRRPWNTRLFILVGYDAHSIC